MTAVQKKTLQKERSLKNESPKTSSRSRGLKKLPAATGSEMVENQTFPKEYTHQPVMLREVQDGLGLGIEKSARKTSASMVMVDGTLGLGGHSRMMLEAMGSHGKLIAFDLDHENLKKAKDNLKEFRKQVTFLPQNFSTLSEALSKLKVAEVDGVLLDLGISSRHVDDPEKGFSFLKEGPLDMRYGKDQTLTAADVVNSYSLKELTRIFRDFGEERYAWKIANEIVARRRKNPFRTTLDLANAVEKLLKRQGHIHPATRIFQAIRIEVNHELDVLQSTLSQAVMALKKGGRLVVISYHSLEDRIVKQFFLAHAREYINLPNEMTTTYLTPTLHILTKKPLIPTESEVKANPRSRSAKLRIAMKI